MTKILYLLLCFQIIISFDYKELYNRTKGVISTAADFIPVVGNVKGFAEAATGKDYIIAVTKDGSSVYAIENVGGTTSADTGTATLGNNEYLEKYT